MNPGSNRPRRPGGDRGDETFSASDYGQQIAWRGPQRGYAARPAYAPAGPGTPARPSPADPSLHPNAHRCALGTPALGAAPGRCRAGRRDCQRACGAGEFRGLSEPALLPEQKARAPRGAQVQPRAFPAPVLWNWNPAGPSARPALRPFSEAPTKAEFARIRTALHGRLGPRFNVTALRLGVLGRAFLASALPANTRNAPYVCGATGNCDMAVLLARRDRTILASMGDGLGVVRRAGGPPLLVVSSNFCGGCESYSYYRYRGGRYVQFSPPGRPSRCGPPRIPGLQPCRPLRGVRWLDTADSVPGGLRFRYFSLGFPRACPPRRNCLVTVRGNTPGRPILLRTRGWAAAETRPRPGFDPSGPHLILARWLSGGRALFTRYRIAARIQGFRGAFTSGSYAAVAAVLVPGNRLLPDACMLAAPGPRAKRRAWNPALYRLRPRVCFPLPPPIHRRQVAIPVDTTRLRSPLVQNRAGQVFATNGRRLFRWRRNRWHITPPPVAGAAQPYIIPAPPGTVAVEWGSRNGLGDALAWYRGRQRAQVIPLPQFGSRPLAIMSAFPSPTGLQFAVASAVASYPDCKPPADRPLPGIYRLAAAGRFRSVYRFRPMQFGRGPCSPAWNAQPWRLAPLASRVGPQHYWLWRGSGPRHSLFHGVLDVNHGRFTYHARLPGLPGPPSGVYPWNRNHAAVAVRGFGLYLVNLRSLGVRRLAPPRPGALLYVAAVQAAGRPGVMTHYVLAAPRSCRNCRDYWLWHRRRGQWRVAARFLSPRALPMLAADGVWFNALPWIGLRHIPPRRSSPLVGPTGPRVVDWRVGLPLRHARQMFRLPAGKILAWDGARTAAFAPAQFHAAVAASSAGGFVLSDRLRVLPDALITVAGPGAGPANGPASGPMVWRLFTGGVVARWAGHHGWQRMTSAPRNLQIPRNTRTLDFDLRGRLWLLPGCNLGPTAMWNPAAGSWTVYPGLHAALAAAHPRLLHPRRDGIRVAYGPGGRIAFYGVCDALNYFNGRRWHIFRRGFVGLAPGPPRFTPAGRLQVVANGWGSSGASMGPNGSLRVRVNQQIIVWTWTGHGWRRFSRQGVPPPPQLGPMPPPGCPTLAPASIVRDQRGRTWWVAQDRLYEADRRHCRIILRGTMAQPFIDGRHLASATALAGGGELLTTRITSAALIVSPATMHRAVAVYSLPAQPVSPPACAKCPTGAGIRPLRLHALQIFQKPRLHQQKSIAPPLQNPLPPQVAENATDRLARCADAFGQLFLRTREGDNGALRGGAAVLGGAPQQQCGET